MTNISIKTYAKLNLSLLVKGKLENGYHNMDMVTQSINIFDIVDINLTSSKEYTLKCSDENIPVDERNIITKCCKAFFEYTGVTFSGINIHLTKNIPDGSGLGGGSSNGAGVLFALNKIYDTRLPLNVLIEIGQTVGADIPFFLVGGTCHITGFGEIVTPLQEPLNSDYFFVVTKCKESIKTRTAFQYIDDIELEKGRTSRNIINMIERDNYTKIQQLLYNDFEYIKNTSVLSVKKHFIYSCECNPLMTGTGSAVFSMFRDEKIAKMCYEKMKKVYPTTFLAKPTQSGFVKN